jgi:phosphate uptake regulator
MLLITLDQAKANLQIDFDVSDDEITEMIHEASELVVAYLKDAAYEFTDTSGEILQDSSGADLTPWRVKRAVKLLVNELYSHRGEDGGKEGRWEMGYLPPHVMACLYMMRDPAFA